jgi:predicted alpha/beta hydrolase family esterase
MPSPVLIFPGFGNSGPEHWQSLWESTNPDFVRVPQRDFDHPVCEEWASVLEDSVRRLGPSVVVVAHSLGCLAVAHWALNHKAASGKTAHSPIKGALLVALPDPNGPNFPAQALGFSPLPQGPFSFPSTVVASSNDPYGSQAFVQTHASAWGSRVVNLGAAGHINAASGLGTWMEGFSLLQQLRA